MQSIEQAWLDQAQQGDPEAFTVIIDTFEKPVFNLCYRMLGNLEDAEDASQETFLRAYQSLRMYDRARPFGTWLLSIAAHFCIDQIRRRRYPTVSFEDLAVPDVPDNSPDIEKKLTIKEEQNQIRSLLHKLDPVDRAGIVMYYWYDLSYEEISKSLNLSVSALKSRLHRARRAMASEWIKAPPDTMTEERRLYGSSTI